MATWRELIAAAMQKDDDEDEDDYYGCKGSGDIWVDVVACTLTDAELDVEFDSGYGGTEGKPFTLWTKRYVYFPVCYDGAESVGFASRDPDGKPTEHWGGG